MTQSIAKDLRMGTWNTNRKSSMLKSYFVLWLLWMQFGEFLLDIIRRIVYRNQPNNNNNSDWTGWHFYSVHLIGSLQTNVILWMLFIHRYVYLCIAMSFVCCCCFFLTRIHWFFVKLHTFNIYSNSLHECHTLFYLL